jgi:transcriptional regulator with XRE-family HTH domain
MSYFGINIKKLRRLKSLSQTDFADIIGLKRGALGAYEEGRSEPKIETVIQTANNFSISIDGLLTRELSINELLNFDTNLTTDETQLRKAYPKIPFINKASYSDYVQYYNKDNFISKLPYIEWPVEDTSKTYRFYEVSDLEMSNSEGGLYPKDIILLEKVELSPEFTPFKALVLYDELKFRNIGLDNNLITLKAEHPAIEDIVIDKPSIKEVWKLIGYYQKYRQL